MTIEAVTSKKKMFPALQFAVRQRQDFQAAELRLGNQIGAIRRRLQRAQRSDQERRDTHAPDVDPAPAGEMAFFHLELVMADIAKERKRWDKDVARLAKELPIWPWAEGVRGIGALSLGQIIAEAGDPSNYANPAKLWRRFGLAVFDGKSQRRVKGQGAIEQGFSPRRRALMFVVADNLVKTNRDGAYRTLYLARKEYEREHHPDLKVGHIDKRAKRYMGKRLLCDLWKEWGRANIVLPPIDMVPDPTPSEVVATPVHPDAHASHSS